MITVLSRKPDNLASPDVSKVNKEIIEYCGLSTDEKPNGLIVTGSTFFEVDTGDMYVYSEATAEWLKLTNLKGESGGGGGTTGERKILSGTFRGIEPWEGGYITAVPVFDLIPEFYYSTDDGEGGMVDHNLGSALKVIFDGVTYEDVPYSGQEGNYGWGDPNLSEYPFVLTYNSGEYPPQVSIGVADDNEHTIEVYMNVTSGNVTVTNGLDEGSTPIAIPLAGELAAGETADFSLTLYGGVGAISGINEYDIGFENATNAAYNSYSGQIIVYGQPASITLMSSTK